MLSARELKGKISDAKNKHAQPGRMVPPDARRTSACQQDSRYLPTATRSALKAQQRAGLRRSAGARHWSCSPIMPPVLEYYRQPLSATSWWTSIRTPTARSTSWSTPDHGETAATCAWWATTTSPSTAGAARTSATFWTSRRISRTAKVIKLEQNYRSTANILDAANQVIAHNAGRMEKAPVDGAARRSNPSNSSPPETSGTRPRASADQHRRSCTAATAEVRATWPFCTAPTPRAACWKKRWCAAGIPYRVYGGQRFYDRKEVKDI